MEFFGNVAAFEVEEAQILEIVRIFYREKHWPLKLIAASDERAEQGCFKIRYVFGVPGENRFIIPYLKLKDKLEFPSITSVIHGALNYEKKIRTLFGLIPLEHPDPRPDVLHENWPGGLFPLRKDFALNTRPELAQGSYSFKQVKGEGIYEIPVGPIHAGIIEPGHFRFSVAGEEIMLLEARLGFTHKGSEKLFESLSLAEKIRLSEKLSGDSSFAHSLAFCQALEQLCEVECSKRSLFLRVVYAELERLANHLGDIAAIMLDAGFSFGGANGSRLREMVLQLNEKITGSRFLRGVNLPGGVTRDLDQSAQVELSGRLDTIHKDFLEVIEIAENSYSLLNRLKTTGRVSREMAEDRGALGLAARACGMAMDARIDYPYAAYGDLKTLEIATAEDGDVYSRFLVRVKEVSNSVKIIQEALRQMPQEAVTFPSVVKLKHDSLAVSCVEGWRGDIVYMILTDSGGRISRVAPRDPSFINWSLLGIAGLKNIVPDFPLINKSFNLSYTGNDL